MRQDLKRYALALCLPGSWLVFAATSPLEIVLLVSGVGLVAFIVVANYFQFQETRWRKTLPLHVQERLSKEDVEDLDSIRPSGF